MALEQVHRARWLLVPLLVPLLAALVGCPARAPEAVGTPPAGASAYIGPAGGSLQGPNRAAVLIPAGALRADTTLSLELPVVGSSPALPERLVAVGATYALTPRDLEFAEPAVVSIPFDPAQVPSGTQPRLLVSSGADNAGWRPLPGAAPRGNFMTAGIEQAAAFVVVVRVDPP